jgi:hypothetical protein
MKKRPTRRGKPVKGDRKAKSGQFVLGRKSFTAISAVEGLTLSRNVKGMFADFDRDKVPQEKRRELTLKYFKGVRR